ncbi:MAG: hypothetical protein AB9856_02910 [Cellulosilyticaceae bacterium]
MPMIKEEWILCPVCKNKTVINVKQLNLTIIKEPDT